MPQEIIPPSSKKIVFSRVIFHDFMDTPPHSTRTTEIQDTCAYFQFRPAKMCSQ